MRALVTGCAGFIGSHLTEALLAEGAAVVGVDCFNDNYGRSQKLRNLEQAREWDLFDFVPIDLARGDLYDIVEDADVVFHLAAEPGVRLSWGARFETYLRNNMLASQHMLEAARRCPDNRFVFASSSSVYGNSESLPTSETALPRPFSPYGVTKLAAEHLCQLYHLNHGVQTVALRYFSVYGPRQRPDMAFQRFCSAALTRQPITVLGDGEQTRDFTFVSDVVAATLAAARAPDVTGGVYNVGGGSRVSVNGVLEILRGLVDGGLDVRYEGREHGDVRDTAADTTRAREALGYIPTATLEEGLRCQLEWLAEVPRTASTRTYPGPKASGPVG